MQFSQPVLNSRLDKLREKLSQEKIDSLLVSNDYNRFYLTGWPGDPESGYLLITAKKAFILTDGRYTEEAVESTPHFETREFGLIETFWKNLFRELKVQKVGYESRDLSVFDLKRLKKLAKVRFVPTIDLLEGLRATKDQEEIVLLKKSADISDQAFNFVLKNIKPGQTEREIAWEMEKFMRECGAEKNAWNPLIVASGSNSSKVHYAAGERKLKKGDQVLLDWGCYFKGYASDISRMAFLGTPTEKQAQVYTLVLEAQKLAIEQVRADKPNKLVDLAARDFLTKKTKFTFSHAVGHGVGLEVHELPQVNFRTKEKLNVGDVITVEPGIYEPGWGGVRIEDMVLVKKKGIELLTKAPKILAQIVVK